MEVTRITAIHKDSYIIDNGGSDVFAELTGKMLYNAESPMDFPTVGDFVLTTLFDDLAIINKVLPRKSLLKRKTAGKKIDFQLIASNIDTAFIMQSLDANFNIRRLERYIVMAKDSNITPVVLLSKSDLATTEEIKSYVAEIQALMPTLHIKPFSSLDDNGVQDIKDFMTPEKTYCLLGSSGVGKTTLLNKLIGEEKFATKAVRAKDGRGRHATTSRQLIKLDNGAMLIDTAGMRELGNFAVDKGIDETFTEITELIDCCQFASCTHINEKGCAVRQAIKMGELDERRFQSYLKVKRESDFNKMSYLQKKQKGKEFKKHCKNVMKHKKKWK